MLTEKYDPCFLKAFFETIREKSSPETPLHRAKATKTAAYSSKEFIRYFSREHRDPFWNEVKSGEWLSLSPQGYIVGLAPKAEAFLKG